MANMSKRFLVLDTTGLVSSFGLVADNTLVASKSHNVANEQAAVINVLIAELLEEQQWSMSSLAALIICGGPGSYTGMRISYSVAKGICFALDIPLVSVNKLSVLLHQYQQRKLMLAIKARVGEYFVAIHHNGHEVLAPQHCMLTAFEDLMSTYEVEQLITDDSTLAETFVNMEVKSLSPSAPLDLEALAEIGKQQLEKGVTEDIAYSEPLYLKGVHTTVSKKQALGGANASDS